MLKKGRRFLSEPKEEALIWFPFALSLYRHLDPLFLLFDTTIDLMYFSCFFCPLPHLYQEEPGTD